MGSFCPVLEAGLDENFYIHDGSLQSGNTIITNGSHLLPTPHSVGALLDSQRRIAEIVIAMRRCPQPIIAVVQGSSSGCGFALALATDVRIVTVAVRFNAAFI